MVYSYKSLFKSGANIARGLKHSVHSPPASCRKKTNTDICRFSLLPDDDRQKRRTGRKAKHWVHVKRGQKTCEIWIYQYRGLLGSVKIRESASERCPPGFYSSTGLEPCKACPVGFYQASVGSRHCNDCFAPRTTPTVGSTSASDCACKLCSFFEESGRDNLSNEEKFALYWINFCFLTFQFPRSHCFTNGSVFSVRLKPESVSNTISQKNRIFQKIVLNFLFEFFVW